MKYLKGFLWFVGDSVAFILVASALLLSLALAVLVPLGFFL